MNHEEPKPSNRELSVRVEISVTMFELIVVIDDSKRKAAFKKGIRDVFDSSTFEDADNKTKKLIHILKHMYASFPHGEHSFDFVRSYLIGKGYHEMYHKGVSSEEDERVDSIFNQLKKEVKNGMG